MTLPQTGQTRTTRVSAEQELDTLWPTAYFYMTHKLRMAFIYVLPTKHIKDISWWENEYEIQIPMCMKKLWLKHSHTHLSTYCLGLLLKNFLSGASWKTFTNLDLEHYPWLAASLPSGNLLEMQSWAHRRLWMRTWEWSLVSCVFYKPSRWLWCREKYGNHQYRRTLRWKTFEVATSRRGAL